jgi:hypothetical protein
VKIQTDDDPLVQSTFETKLEEHEVLFVMELDYPSDFYAAKAKLRQVRSLHRDDVIELVIELQRWLDRKP